MEATHAQQSDLLNIFLINRFLKNEPKNEF